jgi:CNP1-like family protein
LRFLSFVLLFCVSSAVNAQIKSDWERANEERLKQSQEQAVPPPGLDKARLVEVKSTLAADTDFRFFVDPDSVSVGEDRIVRYVLVARSPSGSESVTFEGIRCPGEYRVYAVGRPDGTWAGRPSEWRTIVRDPRVSQAMLARQYFCPGRSAILSGAEGQKAVRAGGHPGALSETR